MEIVMGDARDVLIAIESANEALDVSNVSKVEFLFANVRKEYIANDTSSIVSYDEVDGCFCVPLLQEETLSMTPGVNTVQIRVKNLDDVVIGSQEAQFKVVAVKPIAEVI